MIDYNFKNTFYTYIDVHTKFAVTTCDQNSPTVFGLTFVGESSTPREAAALSDYALDHIDEYAPRRYSK